MQPASQPEIFSVSQLTKELKNLLENRYQFVRIIGEISNLKTPFSGHSYFTLKDDSAQLQAVLFKQRKRFVDLEMKDGQQVICFGRITVYEPRGNYQLIIDSIEPSGAGQIQLQFEKIKKKLAAQGYFDEERKRPIPQYPEKIAVISSPTGAAFADFLKIVQLRRANVHIQLYPVRVQGESAAPEIAKAIQELDNGQNHEVIVLIRGGGSLEDLQPFNDERVADAICAATLPIVTGIGHQIDYTIADFCADYRCPTPTAAAEHLIADTRALQRQLGINRNRLLLTMRHQLHTLEQQLHYHMRSLRDVTRLLTSADHRLQLSQARMLSAMDEQLAAAASRLEQNSYRLQLHSPQGKITLNQNRLEAVEQRLQQAMAQLLERNTRHLGSTAALLQSVSPLATLARGYSITRKKSATGALTVVRTASEASPGEKVEVLLHGGTLHCLVEKSAPKQGDQTGIKA